MRHGIRRRSQLPKSLLLRAKVLIEFAAVHMSLIGTSRRFVMTRKFGSYWRHSRPERAFVQTNSVENDPERTSRSFHAQCGQG